MCQLYKQASDLHAQGTHLVSCDEKTGIQALERKHPSKPMLPGKVVLDEFEYIRHGTQTLIANLEVATGQCLAPTISQTRREVDFVAHIAQTVDIDPKAAWIFIVDQLNTHKSESLVRFVAERCGLTKALGVKGESGILHTRFTRAAVLADETHRIRFVYTPKHTS